MNESTALITDDSAFSATWYTASSELMTALLPITDDMDRALNEF